MSKPFVPKVGTTAECAAFTGLKNEVVIDEEKGSLIVHDGVTAGGAHEILPKAKNDELYEAVGTCLPKSGGTVNNTVTIAHADGDIGLRLMRTDYEQGTVPSAQKMRSVRFVDKNGLIMGDVRNVVATNGGISTQIWSRKYKADGTQVNSNIQIGVAGNDEPFVTVNGNNVITSAGGTFAGKIDSSVSEFKISKTTNDGSTVIYGGVDQTAGGVVIAYGKDNANAGQVRVRPCNGTNNSTLVAYPDGKLQWNSREVERVNSSGEGYIRYESGLQICWGAYQVSSGTQVSEVIFPVPFLSKSSYVPNANSLTKGNINLICVRDANSANGEKMTVQAYLQGNTSAPTSNYYVAWSARGKWK